MKKQFIYIILCLFVMAACSTSDHAAKPICVRVIDGGGNGIANATVVIGTRTGQVMSFSSTDDDGEAYFDGAPSHATITAAFSCHAPSADRIYSYVDVVYDVNVSVVTLTLETCDQNTRQVHINVTDEVAGVTDREVTLGPITYNGSNVTMDIHELQDDGTISVFATGYDAGGDIEGYGFALDQPAVDGSVIDVAIDRTDLVQHTHRFENVPPRSMSYYAFASLFRKHAPTNLPFNFTWGMAPLPAAMTTYSTAGFADNNMLNATVSVDQDSDGTADADIGLVRYLKDSSNQVFDFGQAPLIPGDLAYNSGMAGRPLISWSNNDSSSTMQKITISYSATSPQSVSCAYTITVPATAGAAIFPDLPDTLADLHPGAYTNLSLETVKFDEPTSYDDYLDAIATYNGRFYEEETLSCYSYTRVSRVP